MTEPAVHDLEARALWHLQLDPAQLYADCFTAEDERRWCAVIFGDEADDFDYEYDEDLGCTHCGGEGYREVDDIWWDDCDEYGWGPCSSCRGTGERRHQWVF